MTLWPVIGVLVLFFMGVPCAFAMMMVCIPYFLADPYMSATVIAQRMLASCESQSLMAIPFFITAGAIMNYFRKTDGICRRAGGPFNWRLRPCKCFDFDTNGWYFRFWCC